MRKLIIVVGCLLLVGAVSFAYFIANSIFSGEGSSVSGTTATINDAELRVEGTLEFNDLDIYPGHQSVSSIKIIVSGDNKLIPYTAKLIFFNSPQESFSLQNTESSSH